MRPAEQSLTSPQFETHRQLVDRAKGGDLAAFEELVNRFQKRVYGLAVRMLGELHDAEDVTQQTFLSVVEHLGEFRGDSDVAAWVLRIAANHALKLLRKRRGLPTVSWDESDHGEANYADIPHPRFIAPWSEDPADLSERREVRDLIERSLAELDDKHRTVFVLRDLEGFSVKETAEMLGLSEANVKVRLLRARLALREKLTRALGDESARVVHEHLHEPTGGTAS